MSKNPALEAEMLGTQTEKPRFSWRRFFLRFFLLLITLIFMAVGGVALYLGTIFNGPSPTARDMLTEKLLSDSRTEWIPSLFWDLEE